MFSKAGWSFWRFTCFCRVPIPRCRASADFLLGNPAATCQPTDVRKAILKVACTALRWEDRCNSRCQAIAHTDEIPPIYIQCSLYLCASAGCSQCLMAHKMWKMQSSRGLGRLWIDASGCRGLWLSLSSQVPFRLKPSASASTPCRPLGSLLRSVFVRFFAKVKQEHFLAQTSLQLERWWGYYTLGSCPVVLWNQGPDNAR